MGHCGGKQARARGDQPEDTSINRAKAKQHKVGSADARPRRWQPGIACQCRAERPASDGSCHARKDRRGRPGRLASTAAGRTRPHGPRHVPAAQADASRAPCHASQAAVQRPHTATTTPRSGRPPVPPLSHPLPAAEAPHPSAAARPPSKPTPRHPTRPDTAPPVPAPSPCLSLPLPPHKTYPHGPLHRSIPLGQAAGQS